MLLLVLFREIREIRSMSSKLELLKNQKPLIRRIQKHGYYFSVGLPQSIKTRMKIDDDEYFKVWYSDDLKAIVYQKLEENHR